MTAVTFSCGRRNIEIAVGPEVARLPLSHEAHIRAFTVREVLCDSEDGPTHDVRSVWGVAKTINVPKLVKNDDIHAGYIQISKNDSAADDARHSRHEGG